MKKIIYILVGLILPATQIQAEEITTEISRVVVYEDRAMVTRSGETNISAGAGEVILAGLPPMIMDDSVRVSGKSAGKVTITGTEVRRSYLVNPRRKDVDRLEQQIKVLKEERSVIDDGLRSLGMEKSFISSIQAAVPEKISKEMLLTSPDPAKWNNVLDFIGQSSTEVFARERKLKAEKKELNKKIKAREKELGEIQSFVSREAKEIAITVEAGQETSLKIEVSYVIRGATWRPVYDARADHDGGTVELTYRAEVRQRTGENWNNVKLALSTARPSIGGRPSELSPWYISIYTPPPPQRRMNYSLAKSGAPAPMEMAEDSYGGDMKEEQAITFDNAEIARAGAAITFEIPRAQVIPSDGTFHGMSVDQTEIKGNYSYITTPKLSEFAYLLARCENLADYPLLSGKINLFLGPDFVGNS
ncbi:MAG: mucoidy inhibitor MuiA family protein, partial [Candidatus Auribacterota bacterium]|nr:mucoidy inhibitor MuiA family protein [Candidatus Auribacterota bacterium]